MMTTVDPKIADAVVAAVTPDPPKPLTWEDHQAFEARWHGDCRNTFGEEVKQLTYAAKMGLENLGAGLTGHWPLYDMKGKSVIDIGGGPASMLLKTMNAKRMTVVDPCPYPPWVGERYRMAAIDCKRVPAEDVLDNGKIWNGLTDDEFEPWDECWIYNCLQHVRDPAAVLATARELSPVIRIFEWLEMEPEIGHPWKLTESSLRGWLGLPERSRAGSTSALDPGGGTDEHTDVFAGENGCHGRAFFGCFGR